MNKVSISPNAPLYQISPSFQRKLRDDEKPEFEKTMNEAFDYLGIQNRALIIHGSSFPNKKDSIVKNCSSDYSLTKLNGKNPYIGTPFHAKEFTDFAKMNGFNAIQLGPNGKLNKRDNSPYHASIFAKNELFLDYDRLKSDEYANILSDKDYNDVKIIKPAKHENYEMTDFDEAQEISKVVTHKAYTNFKTKLSDGDKKAQELNSEFIEFKQNNDYWLEKDSIFRLFSDIHGSDNFENWDSELDKNLIARISEGDKAAEARYDLIKTRPGAKEKMDEYKFIQFLLEKEEQEDKLNRKEDGIKYIGDLLVGYSYADEWSNPDAFLKDWRVGCPEGGKNGGPQLWNIAVLNPDELFKDDGSLGVSGQLLKQKIERTLDGVENIRVDNVMGLVDPYIYKSSAIKQDGSINDADRNYLSETDIDKHHNYPKILHNILIPVLKEHNIDPHDVVWEDLGSQSGTFKEVFYNGRLGDKVYEDEKLNGIMYTKGSQMQHVKGPGYSFLSTHDNEPAASLLEEGSWIYDNNGWNTLYLAGYMMPIYDESSRQKSEDFCKEIEANPRTRLKAKYAELFRGTPNIQVSFADLFGIDKTYNLGGHENNDNWKLRLNADYENTYYKSLETEKEPAMNMPELLGIAVNSRAGMEIIEAKREKSEVLNDVSDLQGRLEYWKNVLKESDDD
ncbi:MAG: 4-alpha-glucanotransferase [Candidatus Gastranaerophilales bacterium]|nr:4-alpha-glucanotransferase [Candidatus Gastranaerophilales bacterium]